MCKQDLKRPNGGEAGGQRVTNEEGDRPGAGDPSDSSRTAGQRAVNWSHLFIQAEITFVQSPAPFPPTSSPKSPPTQNAHYTKAAEKKK